MKAASIKPEVVIESLGALAHEHRLGVFRLLVERGPEGMPAGTIAAKLSLPPSSLSFHLHALQHAGLVRQRRASRQLIYTANFEAMNGLVAYLTRNCCGEGGPECAPVCQPERRPSRRSTPGKPK
jgi:DNA-binding transcriptional ArsR family regulator